MGTPSRRQFLQGSLALVGLSLLAGCVGPPPRPGSAAKVARVGILEPDSPGVGSDPRLEAFRKGLRELGYVEGQNLALEIRYAEQQPERLAALADELARSPVDVIYASGTAAAQSAKEAAKNVPIVFNEVADPVGLGLVAGLGKPGGNLTGLTSWAPGIIGRQVELLKAMAPGLRCLAVPWFAGNQAIGTTRGPLETAARALELELGFVEVDEPEDLPLAFEAAAREGANGLFNAASPLAFSHRHLVVDLAARYRLPAIYEQRGFPEIGGLASYGPNVADLHRRAAGHVDRILGGTRPAELPVKQPTTFDFVVNLATARSLGLDVRQPVFGRADESFEGRTGIDRS